MEEGLFFWVSERHGCHERIVATETKIHTSGGAAGLVLFRLITFYTSHNFSDHHDPEPPPDVHETT